AGYHLTALALIAADPDAEHKWQSLLSAEERHFQLHGLAGPRRKLPDRRVHELFEERVRAHPDAIAAVHGDRQWTYRQLNGRANQLARALLARGLCREGVIAVVTERNLDWMAAVIAIFKAGGAYLPIEPHFPSDRIARTLSRAGCRLVLTERGSTATLDHALDSLSGVEALFIDAAYEEDHADGDLRVDVAPDQLAYIYFTSGSTGEPKGAMCEHAGMLNHLYAKIHDLRIGEGQVVAQTAPQCFDISLWQLVSALLVGGQTLVVGQETILDAERFIDKVVEGRVAVLQVVPSYLEVVLSYLEQHPRELSDLRFVSVTGAARRTGRARLLRGMRRPRVRQRPGAYAASVHGRSAPRGPAAVPERRLWPLAARGQAGVPRPPGYPGQDQWLPDRDRRDREHTVAGAGCPRRRSRGHRAGRPQQAPRGVLLRPAATRRQGP